MPSPYCPGCFGQVLSKRVVQYQLHHQAVRFSQQGHLTKPLTDLPYLAGTTSTEFVSICIFKGEFQLGGVGEVGIAFLDTPEVGSYRDQGTAIAGSRGPPISHHENEV